MHHQSGTVRSLNHNSGEGFLSQNHTAVGSIFFRQIHIDGHKSLCVGEPVLYDVVGEDQQEHAEHVRRSIGELEVYQDLGGLYS